MRDERLKPKGESTERQLVEFVKRRAYQSSPLYANDFSLHRKSELYDQNEQWNRRAHVSRDSRYPSQWQRVRFNEGDPNSIPLPVYNEGVAIRENESARLGRPEYKPRVRPKGQNPGLTEKEGAQGAERALVSRLKDMPWDVQEDQLTFNMPVYGGAWLMSWWDQDWLETVRVPAPAVACPRNPNLQREEGGEEALPEAVPTGPQQLELPGVESPGPAGFEGGDGQPAPEAGLGAGIQEGIQPQPQLQPPSPPPCPFVAPDTDAPEDGKCPLCPDHPPLTPYKPTLEEAQGELGVDVPKGDWHMGVKWAYEIFPRDAGININRTDVDEWVWIHRETIDWVTARWPHKVRDEQGKVRIRAENPATLMAEDPLLGSPDLYAHAEHAGIYQNHVLVYDYCCKPKMLWVEEEKRFIKDKGRHVTIIQDTAVRDDDLLLESLNQPGVHVERHRLEFIPWEFKEGGRRSTVGQSLWDRLFDPQDGVNERKSQIRAVNQRGAVPWYIEKKGINLETKAAEAAIPFRRIRVDIDPEDRQWPPLELLNNSTIDPGAYAEVEDERSTMERISGDVEVEKGQVPTGVSAATAIAYLKTEAGEKRRPRIRRIRQALIRGWEHGLRLMAARYIEPRPYSFEDESGEERWAFIHGKVIAKANPKVDIYPTPDYDVTDARRESIRDMVTLGILRPDQTPQVNRKIVRALDETVEFFIDDDQQEEQAQREWRDFKEDGKTPVIDPIDDPMTHYQEHGRVCFSAWFRQKEEEANWDGVLGILGSDWEQANIQMGFIAEQQPGTSLQSVLMQRWVMVLEQAGFQVMDPEALKVVMLWRAHMEAHKVKVLIAQMKAAAAEQPSEDQPSGEVQAPGRGSSPTSQSEEESETTGGGGPGPGQGAPPPVVQ
jgi:hypothetical protein